MNEFHQEISRFISLKNMELAKSGLFLINSKRIAGQTILATNTAIETTDITEFRVSLVQGTFQPLMQLNVPMNAFSPNQSHQYGN
jgi:hypothetical protein